VLTALSQVPQELTEDSGEVPVQDFSFGDQFSFRPALPRPGEGFAEGDSPMEPMTLPRTRYEEEDPFATTPLLPVATTLPPAAAAEALLPAPQQETASKPKLWKFFPREWKGPTWPREFSRVHLFTLVSLAALSVPLTMAHGLAQDSTAHYFTGPWANLAPIAPFLTMVAHVAHVRAGKLSLAPAFLGTIPGSVVLAIVANAYVRSTLGDLPDMLASNDCAWYDVKESVDLSWQAAERIYIDCQHEHELKFPDSEVSPTLQDCETYLHGISSSPITWFKDGFSHAVFGPRREFNTSVYGVDDYAVHRITWRYFARLEAEQKCSGWCHPERPLWTSTKTKDSCSKVAGYIMKQKVQPAAYGMLAYSSAMIVVAAVGIGILAAQGIIKDS